MSSAAATAASPGYALRLARLADERLAVRVAGGDARAFAAIYERYHQQLVRQRFTVVDGEVEVPSEPGSGVELDEEVIRACRVQ